MDQEIVDRHLSLWIGQIQTQLSLPHEHLGILEPGNEFRDGGIQFNMSTLFCVQNPTLLKTYKDI
jgi:hypothetical protein